MMPHLPYVDAVHAALVAADLTPDTVNVAAADDGTGDLCADYNWPDSAVFLWWSSAAGWRHMAPHGVGPLMVDGIADPAAVVTVVRALADGDTPPTDLTRWTGAAELDRALSVREDRI